MYSHRHHARVLFTKCEANTYLRTQVALCICGAELRLVLWGHSLYFVTWNSALTVSDMMATKFYNSLLKLLRLLPKCLFNVFFHPASVVMGTYSVCLFNEVSKPIHCAVREDLWNVEWAEGTMFTCIQLYLHLLWPIIWWHTKPSLVSAAKLASVCVWNWHFWSINHAVSVI